MSTCNIVILVLGAWAVFVTILYFLADSKHYDAMGWVNRTQSEIDYIHRRYPELWKQVSEALALRYLDEGDQ